METEMNEIHSDDEIELISSLNLRGNSLEVSRKELSGLVEKLDEINNFDKNKRRTVNTLEDCITNSTLSIYDLIENNNKILEDTKNSNNTISTNNTIELEAKEEPKLTIDISDGDIKLNIDNVNIKIKSHKTKKSTSSTADELSIANNLKDAITDGTKYQVILLILLVLLNIFRK
ncbi:hypothetical protein TpMuguga_03g00127 [Theileria parva strain Muguga]|uniref:Uncharacterized protein n=1 Tax=Theileria parva TaxID=5875 RepID=Q4N0W2_THEPA|nr:uncharacterized protein TpMuguga_03g00127 [Theileria parva strain Muguga]EAN30862.1 hypothetical protein TpMuguga_03g00127 [Theileria parva strain Muguga]|eukprot:XP_763145.1 hypothetical protein [Theileria parva strain Muguga]